MAEDAITAGFVFLSADYTLLGPHTAWAIVQDVNDLVKWIHSTLNEELEQSGGTSVQVDPARTVVAGGSGGGAVAFYAVSLPSSCVLHMKLG